MYLCTYFDSAYAAKGWVCNYTLHQQDPEATLFILCFDEAVYNKAKTLSGVIPIRLDALEKRFPELVAVKPTRLLKEYYATISPILPLYIFENYNHVETLFYTDADIAFWSAPQEMKEVMGDSSLMVVDHGFEPPRSGVRFNVGILGYRNDADCEEFLLWWKDRCLEWCKWTTLPNGMCADQGYLNTLHDEPEKFKNVLSCPHPGINMGPWNIAKHKITQDENGLLVDGQYNLICYHYHEFRMIGSTDYYPTGWAHTISDRHLIYEPYFKLMQQSMAGEL